MNGIFCMCYAIYVDHFLSYFCCSLYICRLAELGIEARSGFKSHGEGSTQLSGSIQLSSKESFFGKAEAKTIADINTISEIMILYRF